jgi:hypothetical protein
MAALSFANRGNDRWVSQRDVRGPHRSEPRREGRAVPPNPSTRHPGCGGGRPGSSGRDASQPPEGSGLARRDNAHVGRPKRVTRIPSPSAAESRSVASRRTARSDTVFMADVLSDTPRRRRGPRAASRVVPQVAGQPGQSLARVGRDLRNHYVDHLRLGGAGAGRRGAHHRAPLQRASACTRGGSMAP